MSLGVRKPGSKSLSCGEMLDEWQKLWGQGERSFLMVLGWKQNNSAGGQPSQGVRGRGQGRLRRG